MDIGQKKAEERSDRAVSPVIGVILMVAITVILAAVIAAFVMDIGPADPDPTAGVSFDEDASGEVEVTWHSQGQNDGELYVHCDGDLSTAATHTITNVGATATCTTPSNEVVVMAERSGTEGRINSYDVS